MNLVLESVAERDIDLLIVNKFMTDNDFVNSFCSLITNPNPIHTTHLSVEEVYHSQMDNDGESDIVVIINSNGKRIGLFIENKIDADAMPNQHGRYVIRAEKNKGTRYDDYRIVLIAPDGYDNDEARKYENRISYEKLKAIAKDNYSIALLDEAIRERNKGYKVIEDEKVTTFREKYYQFIKNNYKYLNVKEVKGPAGSRAVWIGFDSLKKGTIIQHKSDRGYVDLEIAGYGEKAAELLQANKELLLREGLTIVRANKSAAVRAYVPVLDFHKEFESYVADMHVICKAIDKLERIVTELKYDV